MTMPSDAHPPGWLHFHPGPWRVSGFILPPSSGGSPAACWRSRAGGRPARPPSPGAGPSPRLVRRWSAAAALKGSGCPGPDPARLRLSAAHRNRLSTGIWPRRSHATVSEQANTISAITNRVPPSSMTTMPSVVGGAMKITPSASTAPIPAIEGMNSRIPATSSTAADPYRPHGFIPIVVKI